MSVLCQCCSEFPNACTVMCSRYQNNVPVFMSLHGATVKNSDKIARQKHTAGVVWPYSLTKTVCNSYCPVVMYIPISIMQASTSNGATILL